MSVAVVMPAMSQPRFARRLRTLVASGLFPEAMYFSRGYYEQNPLVPEVSYHRLGVIEDGRYIRRLPTLVKACAALRSRVRGQELRGAYAFSLDTALLAMAMIPRAVPLVYEIGDLRVERGSPWWLRAAERAVLGHASLVVVTAPGFRRHLLDTYGTWLERKTVVVENTLDPRLPLSNARPADRVGILPTRPLRIGVVGLLRYARPLEQLFAVAARNPAAICVNIYGDGPCRPLVQEAAKAHPNICYFGPFKYPSDVEAIYQQIDINYVVYDSASLNVRLAIPNKYYESLFFGVPLIAASETQLATRLEERKVGWEVADEDALEALLETLEPDKVREAKHAIASVVRRDLVGEPSEFASELKRLFSE
jgi:succinoglycan biosynthesis protein ExoL